MEPTHVCLIACRHTERDKLLNIQVEHAEREGGNMHGRGDYTAVLQSFLEGDG